MRLDIHKRPRRHIAVVMVLCCPFNSAAIFGQPPLKTVAPAVVLLDGQEHSDTRGDGRGSAAQGKRWGQAGIRE